MKVSTLQNQDRRTFSALAGKRFGVLARVAGLFGGRGCNIAPLTVHQTHGPRFSKLAGKADRIDDLIAPLRDSGIIDMARSGRVAIERCRE